jgi:hypothetical protein
MATILPENQLLFLTALRAVLLSTTQKQDGGFKDPFLSVLSSEITHRLIHYHHLTNVFHVLLGI